MLAVSAYLPAGHVLLHVSVGIRALGRAGDVVVLTVVIAASEVPKVVGELDPVWSPTTFDVEVNSGRQEMRS